MLTLSTEMMPPSWKLNGEGLAVFVERLEKVLRQMLGEGTQLPRTVSTDRGTGMCIPAGKIVNKFEAALGKASFRSYWGSDAHRQAAGSGVVLS